MADAPLMYETAEGSNNYAVAVVAPSSPGAGLSRANFKSPYLRMLRLTKTLGASGICSVEIPDGAQSLVAAVYDENYDVPSGVSITVASPNGTVFNQDTPLAAPNLVVQTQNGSLTALIVTEPDPGLWTITLDDEQSSGEYQFFLSTVPLQDTASTIEDTLGQLVDPMFLGTTAAPRSLKCTLCMWAAASLAVIIFATLAGGVAILTEGSAVVVAAAALIGWTTARTLYLISGLVGVAVGAICEQLCEVMGLCS